MTQRCFRSQELAERDTKKIVREHDVGSDLPSHGRYQLTRPSTLRLALLTERNVPLPVGGDDQNAGLGYVRDTPDHLRSSQAQPDCRANGPCVERPEWSGPDIAYNSGGWIVRERHEPVNLLHLEVPILDGLGAGHVVCPTLAPLVLQSVDLRRMSKRSFAIRRQVPAGLGIGESSDVVELVGHRRDPDHQRRGNASKSAWPPGASAGATVVSSRSSVDRSGSGSCHGSSNRTGGSKPLRGSNNSAVHERIASSRGSRPRIRGDACR